MEGLEQSSKENALLELKNYQPNKEYFKLCLKNAFIRGANYKSTVQIWEGSNLQYKRIDDTGWFDCLDYLEYRIKPKPNLDNDIEALQNKAKELGIKLTILIE